MTDEEIAAAFKDYDMLALAERYEAAAHKMQTGVALEMHDPERMRATEPKHLRVGVNSALVDSSALALALMRKGVLTPKEYLSALVTKMEEEANAYERRAQRGGASIKLY